MEITIYIANLGKYNEGELVGGWLTLPVSEKELQEHLKTVVKIDGVNYEEYAIHDFEAIDGLKIGEYTNIKELNELAERALSVDEETLKYLITTGEFTFEEALDKVESGDGFRLWYDCDTMEDVAEQYAEETGLLESVPENLRFYFDFAAYGRDMEIEGSFYRVSYNTYVELY
jgi:antirestriction protein